MFRFHVPHHMLDVGHFLAEGRGQHVAARWSNKDDGPPDDGCCCWSFSSTRAQEAEIGTGGRGSLGFDLQQNCRAGSIEDAHEISGSAATGTFEAQSEEVGDRGSPRIESPDISSIDSDSLVGILSYFDPTSVGRCEMTSKKMKRAAESAWSAIEESYISKFCFISKDARSSAKSARERVVIHFVLPAREFWIRQRKGNNKSRRYLHANPSYLSSHGVLDETENYEYYLRISDGRLE